MLTILAGRSAAAAAPPAPGVKMQTGPTRGGALSAVAGPVHKNSLVEEADFRSGRTANAARPAPTSTPSPP